KRTRHKFYLKVTLANGDGIARHNEITSAASLREALRVTLENLIATRIMPPHRYSFRCSDAGVPASHRDRLQQIDTARTAFGHFETSGPTYLAQNRKTSLCIAEEHDIDPRAHQIISAVQLR